MNEFSNGVVSTPPKSEMSALGVTTEAVARIGHVVSIWVAVPPGAVAVLMGLVAPRLATDPLVVTAIAATGYTLCALLVDRRLLADLRYLADAKSDPRP